MDPHMHHLRPSSALHFKFSAINKVVEEESETDMEVEEEEEEEEEEGSGGFGEEPQLKKKRMNFVGSSSRKKASTTTASEGDGGGGVAPPTQPPPSCRAEKCKADLSDSKRYHQRHKVCEYHAKAQVVMVDGLKQRFCQQCSRFHELSEFDEAKRSCRQRLAGHNERRRKSSSESRTEASGRRGSNLGIKKDQCRQADELGRTPMVFRQKHQNFHIH
ncbi:hypothetical protein ACH5RR_028096 [Cinchona calisaya]|uniref:SBP-type domain-containing protein n=1 Tax=Cinchona calisaya TaxID=153742 RepID=A0ABD2YRD1_9GENT